MKSRKLKSVVCGECGFKSNQYGIGPHMRSAHGISGTKKGISHKRKYAKRTEASGDSTSKVLKIPCSLGGHEFAVKVILRIEATSIVDA